MVLILTLAACTQAAGNAPSSDGNSALPVPVRLGEVVLDGAPEVGGLSGLWIAPDGSRLVAVGDTGTVFAGRPVHDPGGILHAVADRTVRPLPGIDGRGKAEVDAEALALTGDGAWLIAYERRHRILHYGGDLGSDASPPSSLGLPHSIQALPANGGIEALAAVGGTIVACAETRAHDGHPCWLRRDGRWHETRYRGHADFDSVDMAALPNGDLLVLERSFTMLGWFQSRLALVRAADLDGGGPLRGRDLGPVQAALGADNLEGLAVRQDEDGRVLAYLVADDNFSPLQRTVLVQYLLAPAGPGT